MTAADGRDPLDAYLRGDPLWRMAAYRKSVALADLVWDDLDILDGNRVLIGAASQLVRAVGSIRANLAEGYSRSSGRDRAKFFEYSLGSTREAREWYHYLRRPLGRNVTEARMRALSEIVRLQLVIIPQERARTIRRSLE